MVFLFYFGVSVPPVPGRWEGSTNWIRWASQDLPHEALGHQRGSRQVQVLVSDFLLKGFGFDIWVCGFNFLGLNFGFVWIRYFLRKLKKVKKSNGQVLAINEVYWLISIFDLLIFFFFFWNSFFDDIVSNCFLRFYVATRVDGNCILLMLVFDVCFYFCYYFEGWHD